MQFQDRVAIVTGGASGIGLATARLFARRGASVIVADVDAGKAQQAVEESDAAGIPRMSSNRCDVSKAEDVEATVRSALDRFGQLDIVVNNAGLMSFKPIEELTSEDWHRVLSVDLVGAFNFIKQAFLVMRAGGAIVNVSSVHAVETEPLVAPYAAAKTALLSLTRSAALEGKPKRIRVNAVLPGAVDTPMLWGNPNIKSGAERLDGASLGKPEEIAAAIAFLASDEASFIQGAAIRVDGGRLTHL